MRYKKQSTRPDLLERSILVKLLPIDKEQRKTEAQLKEQFQEHLPSLTGALYTIVSKGLANLQNVKLEEMPRMADFAQFVIACEKAAGLKTGEFLQAFYTNQADTTDAVIDNSAVAQFLIEKGYDRPYENTIGELYQSMLDLDSNISPKEMPRGSSKLSKELNRLKPALAKQGVYVEFMTKTRKGRRVRITVTDEYKARIEGLG